MKMFVLTSSAAIEQQISAYHTLAAVFLIAGCVFLAITAVLFFWFRIANIFAVKLGIAAKRTIKEIEDVNAETGRMNIPKRKGVRTVKKTGSGGQKWNTSQLNAQGTVIPPSQIAAQSQSMISAGSGETSLLESGGHETGVLGAAVSRAVSETSDLKDDAVVQIGKFIITRNIMMIHTDETI